MSRSLILWIVGLGAVLNAACSGGSGSPSSTSGSSTASSTSTTGGQSSSSGSTSMTSTTNGASSSGTTTTGGATGPATSSSSSSSSGAGTTSGTTTGETQVDGGCLVDGHGGSESSPCLGDWDCACPLGCGLGQCRQPCTVTTDCARPEETCRNAFCQALACVNFNTPCDSSDAGDGTCSLVGGSLVCVQGGTATLDGGCTPSATRQTPDMLCPLAYACIEPISATAACRELCNPMLGSASGCPAGEGCDSLAFQAATGDEGFCAPVSDAGCSLEPTGSAFEGGNCTFPADCDCPRVCVIDPGRSQGRCQTPCSQSADCASPVEWCAAGLCRLIACGVLPDGGRNGVPGGICASGAESGSCFGAFGTGQCYRGGTSTTECDVAAVSWNPSDQCAQGSLCYAQADGGTCVTICDPDAGPAGCPAGYGCDAIFFEFGNSIMGECVALGPGGCNASGRGETLSICDTSAHCACPYVCREDAGTAVCQAPCASSSDCPDPSTSCQNGFCVANLCDTVGALCDAGNALDGVCQSLPFPSPPLVCVQGGTATNACQRYGTRDPSQLCAVADICDDLIDGGTCTPVCDPAAPACTSPQVCLPIFSGGDQAASCVACRQVQDVCTDTAQCCVGECDLEFAVCL